MKALRLLLAALGGAAARGTHGYNAIGRSDGDRTLRFSIAVKPTEAGRSAIERKLWEVSDPTSPKYGKHLTKDAVDALSAPAPESINAVASWLASHEVHGLEWSAARDWVAADVPISKLETMLSTQYTEYAVDGKEGYTVNRCGTYSIPSSVAHHIDFVGPVHRFPPSALVPKLHTGEPFQALRGRSLQANGVDPSFLRQLYGVGTTEAKNKSTAQVATGYLGEYASPADLQTFFSQFYPVAKGRAIFIVGPNKGDQPGLEANLDVQYITSMGGAVQTTFWYTDGTRPGDNEPYAVFLQNFSALPDAKLPKVLSTSYSE